jgi:hypothetical protein
VAAMVDMEYYLSVALQLFLGFLALNHLIGP